MFVPFFDSKIIIIVQAVKETGFQGSSTSLVSSGTCLMADLVATTIFPNTPLKFNMEHENGRLGPGKGDSFWKP